MFDFQRFSQTDPRWKNVQLGFDPESTIGQYGCLLTCMTMAATGFGFSETPDSLNSKFKALGPNAGFKDAFVIPYSIARVLSGVTLKRSSDFSNQPAPMADVDASLAAGYPVIVEVDYSNAPDYQYHWIMLYAKQDGDYLLQDPWPYPPNGGQVWLSRSQYAFAGTPDKIILAAMWLEGPIKAPAVTAPTTPSTPSTPPAGIGAPSSMKVYVVEDQLALRTSPSAAPGNLIKRLPLQIELSVLEPASQATGKIGAADQWLNVRDASGAVGYVAAWYVSAARPSPPPPATSPAGAATSMLVRTTTPDVALRSQTVVNDQTLIKRLPFNTRLVVLDPPSVASQRIGQFNQWLRVRDTAGSEGYVAAWYVAPA